MFCTDRTLREASVPRSPWERLTQSFSESVTPVLSRWLESLQPVANGEPPRFSPRFSPGTYRFPHLISKAQTNQGRYWCENGGETANSPLGRPRLSLTSRKALAPAAAGGVALRAQEGIPGHPLALAMVFSVFRSIWSGRFQSIDYFEPLALVVGDGCLLHLQVHATSGFFSVDNRMNHLFILNCDPHS